MDALEQAWEAYSNRLSYEREFYSNAIYDREGREFRSNVISAVQSVYDDPDRAPRRRNADARPSHLSCECRRCTGRGQPVYGGSSF